MKKVDLSDEQIKYVLNSLGQVRTNSTDTIKVTDMISIFQNALKQEPYEYFSEVRMMPWFKEAG
jgi:hypothetical protein|tara:strand:+ start:163 stop:354 length:192 start_codon:yes stop_codon:yes gene_type:complete